MSSRPFIRVDERYRENLFGAVLAEQEPNLSRRNSSFFLKKLWVTDATWVRCIAPASLNDAEQLLGRFLSSSDVGLAIFDDQLRFVALNNALAQMNGIPPEKHLGERVSGVLVNTPDLAIQIEQLLERVLTTGHAIANVEITGKLETRTEVGYWIENFFPIKDDAGKVIQVGVVITEITAQKKMEGDLRELTDDLQQERDRLEMLLEINNALLGNVNLKKLFPVISGYIRAIMKQDYASIAIYDEPSDSLRLYALDFPLAKQITAPETYIPVKSGPAGRAFVEKQVKVFSREDLSQHRSEFINRLLDHGIGSLCCIPLVTATRTIGILNLASRWNAAFSVKDVELLKQVGSQIASALDNARAHGEIEALKNRLAEEKLYLEDEIRSELNFEEIIGESANFKNVLAEAKTVAPSDATVLILGETGTGKELIARAIHRMSSRGDRTFVKVNCAAIPTGLLESELFGHEKGAFTGAISQKIGRMELADNGTFFLDEVGEIPLELQPKLLRVLQDQEFERLGSTRTQRISTRIIAATNCDLSKAVAHGAFRVDLFYRLNVFPIRVPPLRERPDDIPMLVRYFVQKISRRMNKRIETIPSETTSALVSWHWPGNIRELENFIERSVILTSGTVLHAPLAEIRPSVHDNAGSQNVLERMEREQIIRALRETGGVIAGPRGAAARLGLKRTTLQSRIQKLGISLAEYQS